MSIAVAVLKKGEGRALKSGGPWVYDNEIASIMGLPKDTVYTKRKILRKKLKKF